ncbi:unnamed protein product [Taenia asiatica]|uniref:DUF5727 domain-containing protein n=1 Tax=Taenia asiatica TaxID=60517 RepID=A0A0R3W1N8_TAEAS|nr:unnamed protein product [Taenia asiatica]
MFLHAFHRPDVDFILEKASLTMEDVTKQERIQIIDYAPHLIWMSTTYFVPYCMFPTPEPGHVDLLTSFPFTRFVKGRRNFILAFGVRGADSKDWARLYENGTLACTWEGDELRYRNNPACAPMLKHKDSDLRVFYGRFRPRRGAERDIYYWSAGGTYLTVTVDYTQSGISPEVDECNRKFCTTCNLSRVIPL